MNFLSISLCVVATLFATDVAGHGTLKTPWGSQSANGPIHTEQCNDIAPNMKPYYGHYPTADMDSFANDFRNSAFGGDLRKLFQSKNFDGNSKSTRTNWGEQDAPTYVKWQNHNADNFIIDHNGPCAIYVVHGSNAKRIFQHDDCVKDYRHSNINTPTLPSECGAGGCTMEFYWLVTGVGSGVTAGQAQYYYAATKLKGTGSGGSDTGTDTGTDSGNNNNKDCTSQNEDPYVSGNLKQCCAGLTEELKDWNGDGRWHYKCTGTPIFDEGNDKPIASPTTEVVLSEQCNENTSKVVLEVGSYTKSQLTTKLKAFTQLAVPKGFIVTGFSGESFTGQYKVWVNTKVDTKISDCYKNMLDSINSIIIAKF